MLPRDSNLASPALQALKTRLNAKMMSHWKLKTMPEHSTKEGKWYWEGILHREHWTVRLTAREARRHRWSVKVWSGRGSAPPT